MQIPIASIRAVLFERQSTRSEAIDEVAAHWGGTQSIAGPFLMVPYRVIESAGTPEDQVRTQEVVYTATFLPRALEVDVSLQAERRYRGIFEIPVYRSRIVLEGEFARPDFSGWSATPEVLWDRAHLAFAISDPHSVQDGARLLWDGRALEVAAGLGAEREGSGLHAATGSIQDAARFRLELELNGSAQLRVAPLGRTTSASIHGDWPEPSFQGAWLPAERRVDRAGFEARWRIPHLARNYPERWASGERDKAIEQSLFGVDLLTPVDTYRTTQRSLKYQLLFLGLTFVTIWLFEVRVALDVHPIQYALIGAALCLFYLLELSLAEHLGFALAYALAAGGVVALVTAYASAVLRTFRRGVLLGAGMAALYAYLYVLLQIQDFALLIGSLGLFAMLAALMWSTHRVDWYAIRPGRSERAPDR